MARTRGGAIQSDLKTNILARQSKDMKKHLSRIKRFSLAGIANTLIGFLLISILQLATGQPYLANILGYSIGCIFAYFVHTRYTFRAKVGIHSFIIYIWITASGVALNLIVLNIALRILPAILSQALAVISYSFYSYFLQSWLSFGEKDQITIKNKPL